jgi:alpha-glucosidase
VLSNHDVIRHASRYGLPQLVNEAEAQQAGQAWLASGGADPPEDRALGEARARAATLFMLALPGSAYLYQGEELGLPEVATLPAEARQDPTFFRSAGREIGRDGARVPLPWTPAGPSFGFGPGPAHLPQPDWFADYAASVQETRPDSTLAMYRQALALRRRYAIGGSLTWVDAPADVLHWRLGGGFHGVTNFGAAPVPRPPGRLLLASGALPARREIPPATTLWLLGE